MIGGNATMAAAFIGEDSQYIASGNFIDGLQSMGCPIGGPRLFKEDPGAQCFNGGTTCDGTCEIMADAEICSISGDTMTPTISGTPAPSIVEPTTLPEPTTPPIEEPTAPPIAEPTRPPIDEPTTAPTQEPTTSAGTGEPSLQPVPSPVAPPVSKPTYMYKPPPMKPSLRPASKYPPYYSGYNPGGNGKGSKSSKGKTSKSSKQSKGYPHNYPSDTKGSKGLKGFSYDHYPPPPPRPYGNYAWRPPPLTQPHSRGSDHHNQRYWTGSNNNPRAQTHNAQRAWTVTSSSQQQAGGFDKRSWTTDGAYRSPGNQGTAKRPGLRPHRA